MFQNSLNTYIVTKLNLNTQGITFAGDYLFQVDSGNFTIKTQDGYSITETNYTPIQIEDWRNTSQPYKRIDLQDLVAPITIAIRQTELAEALLAIEEFRTLLNSSSDTVDGLKVGFRVGQPSAPSSPLNHAGNHWVLVRVVVMLSGGDGLIYGNEVTFGMAKDGETLEDIIYAGLDITYTGTTNPSTDGAITRMTIGKVAQSIKVDVFYEDNVDVCLEFLNQLWQENSANQKYNISLDYGFGTPKTGAYRIAEMQHHIAPGIPLGFTMLLYKAT